MAEDVFEHDDGIVDQARERQCESAQHHGIHGAATGADGQKSGKGGERDGEEDRDGSAHTAEEKENHHAGQDQSDGALADQVGDGRFDKERLVKDDACDELFRNINKVLKSFLDSVHHGDGIGVPALLQDRQVN